MPGVSVFVSSVMGNSSNLQGVDMKTGCTQSDYSVTIGLGLCEDLVLYTNSLTCRLPKEEPETGSEEDHHVHVSQISVQILLSTHRLKYNMRSAVHLLFSRCRLATTENQSAD